MLLSGEESIPQIPLLFLYVCLTVRCVTSHAAEYRSAAKALWEAPCAMKSKEQEPGWTGEV